VRKINEIVVHCTATRPGWFAGKTAREKVAEVRRWHIEDRKWRDIGYHYLIDRDGTIEVGRPEAQAGAHVAGRNANTLGVALFGGHGSTENDLFADNFTPEQDRALRALLAQLRGRFGDIPVTGHNQYAAKACPGFSVPVWLKQAPLKTQPPRTPEAIERVTPAKPPVAQPGFWDAIWQMILKLFGGRK
jgi:N-acetylmuramoyl-L-alanine amidase